MVKFFNQEYYTTLADENQELHDVSSTGKERPWKVKKRANEVLSSVYENVNKRKAERLRECGTFLIFGKTESGKLKLKTMNCCRVRLCPMCAWRRSLKIYHHMTKIMEGMEKDKEYGYIFLTLTVQNVPGDELPGMITDMMGGFQRLMQRKAVADITKGWYRGLEITYNDKDDTYHPHFHVVIAVEKMYFKSSRKYLSQEAWTNLWKEAMRLDYTPIVDVRRVKGNTAKAVAEVAKYAVKDTDYVRPDDLELSEQVVRVLDKALDKRRLLAYGGKFKELHKQLNLDDEMDGDLINVGDTDDLDPVTEQEIMYVWHVGYHGYYKNKEF